MALNGWTIRGIVSICGLLLLLGCGGGSGGGTSTNGGNGSGGDANQITWMGYTWDIKNSAGSPGPNHFSRDNVSVDAKGYLHLKVAKVGGVWTCAQMTTTVPLSFATYQWQTDYDFNAMDPNLVLGLYHYAGPDGSNEIDIEYGKWGDASYGPLAWTVYPAVTTESKANQPSAMPDGTTFTSRYTWSSTGVDYVTMSGFHGTDETADVVASWSYQPDTPTTKIPQASMPLCMNFWLMSGLAPTDGKDAEVIVRSFARTTVAPPPIPTSENLLTNAGFESDLTGWEDWGGSVVQSTNVHSGSKALQLTAGDSGCAAYLTPSSGMVSLQLESWTQCSVAGECAWIGAVYKDSSGVQLGKQSFGYSEVVWTHHQETLIIPANTASICIYCYHNPGSGSVYFDDLVVK